MKRSGIVTGALLLDPKGIIHMAQAADAVQTPKTVWGIAELFEWVYNRQKSTGHDTEDCLQAHLDTGIRHIIWAIGRSTVDYHSALPNTTPYVGDSRPETEIIGDAMRARCCLRAALTFAKDHDMTLYARLGMNRHYSKGAYGGGLTSRFAAEHPEWYCVDKKGGADHSRLSYFHPEVRQERIDILCEVARIGTHGLCLDFCRQVPMMRYEPPVVQAYMAKGNPDPQTLDVKDPKFLDWCRFRSGYVTLFMRDLRKALREVERETGRKVPVMARVTDAGLDVNIMEGTDVETWVREGLIDELCTDPLWWLQYRYPDTVTPYVNLAHAHHMKMWGGVGALAAQRTRLNPVSFLQRAKRQYDEGADGVAIYQSDYGCEQPALKPIIPKLADPGAIAALLADQSLLQKYPQDEASRLYGVDNHSRIEALGGSATPMSAL